MRWWLLSFVPGTSQHRLYRGTVAFAEDVRRFAIETGDGHADGFDDLPRILRSRAACYVVVEAMVALLEALKAVRRGLLLAEAEAVLAEHLPTLRELP